MALVTVRASQGGFGVFRNHGPRGLSGPAGGEENFEIALPLVRSEHSSEASLEHVVRGSFGGCSYGQGLPRECR